MGIEPYMVTSSVLGVVAQRLVKTICPSCRETYLASDREKKLLGFTEDEELKLYKGKGCSNCGNTGYKGRTGIREILILDPEIRELVEKGGTNDEIKAAAIKKGMVTLKRACINYILQGKTTVEELLRVAYTQD
jgi:type IV pilus assembly protein PilB